MGNSSTPAFEAGVFWCYNLEAIKSHRRQLILILVLLLAVWLIARLLAGTNFTNQRQVAQVVSSGGASSPPGFLVTTSDGVDHIYNSFTRSGTDYTVTDRFVEATISPINDYEWQLTLKARADLTDVIFPWQQERQSLDGDLSNEFYYYPHILGISTKAAAQNNDWSWWGLEYPGAIALPLMVLADNDQARIVAATNWPPLRVTPMYAAERMVLFYDYPLNLGDTATYRTLIASVTGDEATGDIPWQKALDLYRTWLDQQLGPVTYPDWMWAGEGIFNIQLQNGISVLGNPFDEVWETVKDKFSWVVMWGQMSDYAGSCCGLDYDLHARYDPLITDWADDIVGQGYHAAFYSAPYWADPEAYSLNNSLGRNWLTGWLDRNRQTYGANSYYIDTIGRSDWGEPERIKDLFDDNTIPPATLIEGVVDIYSRPGLTSGALVGNNGLCGAPGKKPADYNSTTFPNFVRYALGDRIIYTGQSNTDYRFWGQVAGSLNPSDALNISCGYINYCATGRCNNGIEYLAFNLGAKFDVISSTFSNPVASQILNEIVAERERVDWWTRRPVYKNLAGVNLSSLPANSRVTISRFEDSAGDTLLAISNPGQEAGLSITVDGEVVVIPTNKVSVVEIAGGEIIVPESGPIIPSGGEESGGGGSGGNTLPKDILGAGSLPGFPPLTSLFAVYTNGSHVAQLQRMLAVDGFYTGLITGYYGDETISAVQKFQTRYNLLTSGSPNTNGYGLSGPATRAKLNELYAEKPGTGANLSPEARAYLIGQLKARLLILLQQLLALLTSST